jgi:O-antigen/teichoic acid export membrane protein
MNENTQKYTFIATTLFSSAISFIKSYLFMDVLSKKDLGYIAIFQSIIAIVGFLQIGSITGGYRLVSFSKERYKAANNTVVTFLIFLLSFTSIIIVCYSLITNWNFFLILGIFVGIASLLTNWWSNLHIALGRTKLLSILTFTSVLISLLFIPILYYNPLYGAILLIGVQPVSFILLSYFFNKDFHFKISFKSIIYFKLVIKYGFVPFFVGILYYVNQQAERWIIGYSLGVESIGEYYLVFLYSTIFLVVPSTLATVNFPNLMKFIRSNHINKKSFIEIFGLYYLQLITYIIISFLLSYYLLPQLVGKFLPHHLIGVSFVKIIFLGLSIYTLVDPITFILNAKLHYKELITIYLVSLIFSLTSYFYLYFNNLSSLTNFAYVNVIFFTCVALGYILYFLGKGKNSLYIHD